MKKLKFLLLNGPNMNFLGIREPEIYGKTTYAELCSTVVSYCNEKNIDCECYQSNHEGALVDKIQESYQKIDGIVFNPAAYTMTSIAILDALKAVGIPTVEVHISDLTKREDFRTISYIKPICVDTIAGRGIRGYLDAVDILERELTKK